MTPALEATGLTKHHGPAEPLAAESGQVIAPNGAGKTTFVRSVATLVRPDRGTLRTDGAATVRHPDQMRRTIGLAGQHPAVKTAMTGRENPEMITRQFGQAAPPRKKARDGC